jgi:hypothetical protein
MGKSFGYAAFGKAGTKTFQTLGTPPIEERWATKGRYEYGKNRFTLVCKKTADT